MSLSGEYTGVISGHSGVSKSDRGLQKREGNFPQPLKIQNSWFNSCGLLLK